MALIACGSLRICGYSSHLDWFSLGAWIIFLSKVVVRSPVMNLSCPMVCSRRMDNLSTIVVLSALLDAHQSGSSLCV